jgi:transcriptional regulator with XRE-family HTH domain
MDKRDLSQVFRERLRLLLQRSGYHQAAFAARVGIDRSALSQLMSGATTRLPRAETLLNIAADQQVSLDWLLGLSQDEGLTGELRPILEMEEGGENPALLARGHTEASGTKVRYVPAGIPDLLRSNELIAYESERSNRNSVIQIDETHSRIGYSRRPESDMEICMPWHTLEIFAHGLGIWSDFPAEARKRQLAHMAQLLDDLYPSLRLFLYDGRERFSVPYTIFGSMRAAIYVGDMYLVLNATEPVRTLTRHFDTLIRSAVVHAHEAASHAIKLQNSAST